MNAEVYAVSWVAKHKAYRNLRLRSTTRLASVSVPALVGQRFGTRTWKAVNPARNNAQP